MDVYKLSISYAIALFPLIAFIFTIPFLIYQYRKFGAIPILKSACFYSFVLYLLCSYFLVILPLPSIKKVATMTGPTMQLTPFQFIRDIIVTNTFDINNITDVIKIFKNSTIYTVIFNIVLTIPFGVYIRYIFKKNWFQTLFCTFFLSLFFEITQLTGLYGIYPRPYRLFDVDDLLVNSLGGLIGYFACPILTFYMPTIDELDKKGYIKGTKVTLVRRFMAFCIDILFIIVFGMLMQVFLYNTELYKYSLLIVLTTYYIIAPAMLSGQTLGKKIIKVKISGVEKKAEWYQLIIRNSLLVYIVLFPISWVSLLTKEMSKDVVDRLWSVIILCQIINIIYFFYNLIKKEPYTFLYEKISKTTTMSTIVENEEENNVDEKRKKGTKNKKTKDN